MTDKPAILATTKTFRTLADGGVSITFEVSPGDAAEAFKLFGMNGSKVGIAPITAEAARSETQRQFAEPDEKVERRFFNSMKPSQQAFILCREGDFWRFIHHHMGYEEPDGEDGARECLCNWFGISTRAQLDDMQYTSKWARLEAEFYAWKHGRR